MGNYVKSGVCSLTESVHSGIEMVLDNTIRKECGICATSINRWSFRTNHCQQSWCEECLKRWIEPKLFEFRARRNVHINCLDPTCEATLNFTCLKGLLPELDDLFRNLRMREYLLQNDEFEHVECTQSQCVGVGYRGQPNIQCFICGHQWKDPDYRPPSLFSTCCSYLYKCICVCICCTPRAKQTGLNIDSDTIQQCPGCGILVEKHGGCLHMTCRICRYEWSWDTGEPWKNGMNLYNDQHPAPT